MNDDGGEELEEFDRPTASWYGEKRLAAAHGHEKTRSELVAETHQMEMSGYDHRELRPAVNTLRDRLPEDRELSDILPAVVDAAETEVV